MMVFSCGLSLGLYRGSVFSTTAVLDSYADSRRLPPMEKVSEPSREWAVEEEGWMPDNKFRA